MKRTLLYYMPLLLFVVTGCAAIRELFFDSAGNPTETANAISGTVYALTGVSLTRVYDAFFTKRGWDNLRNSVNPQSGWAGFLKSAIGSILLGWHTRRCLRPPDARRPPQRPAAADRPWWRRPATATEGGGPCADYAAGGGEAQGQAEDHGAAGAEAAEAD